MNKEERISTDRNPELVVEIMKKSLMARFYLTEERLGELDPYKWASHDDRYRLWVIRVYIELVEPEDSEKRFNLLMYSGTDFSKQASFTFRYLYTDKMESFRKNIESLGFKINQIPSMIGPWGTNTR